MSDTINKDKLRQVAMSDHVLARMYLSVHEFIPVELLGDMGEAKQTADRLTELKKQHRIDLLMQGRIDELNPKHEPAYKALDDAVEAVGATFEKVLDAVYDLLTLVENCDCRRCKQRRQADKANQS